MDPNDMEMQDMNQLDDNEYYDAVVKRNRTVRELPAPMGKKRELRDKIDDGTNRKLSSYQEWKLGCALNWKRSKENIKNAFSYLEVWRGSLKEVEGKFGSAVTSYFVFLKWLMFLNLYIFLLELVFVVIPQSVFARLLEDDTASLSDLRNSCAAKYGEYDPYIEGKYNDFLSYFFDIIDGTGFVEDSYLFYGYYKNKYVVIYGYNYDMSLAYLLVTISYLVVSFVQMIRRASKSFEKSLSAQDGSYYKYCSKVFAAWDYSLTDEKNAKLRLKAIEFQYKAEIAEQKRAEKKKSMEWKEKAKLYTLRGFLNFIICAVLVASGYLIWYTTDLSLTTDVEGDYGEKITNKTWLEVVILIFAYLPSITLTVLNFIVPNMFHLIISWEKYSPQTTLNISLLRIVILRLSSLGVLVFFTIGQQHFCSDDVYDDECGICPIGDGRDILCWETRLGQEMYKLMLIDFLANIGVIFLIEFPRKLIGKCCNFNLAQKIAHLEFDVPQNLLDLIYQQAILWLATFYSPLTPGMVVVVLFCLFYSKKLVLLKCYQPTRTPYLASRSNFFFIIVLIITFLIFLVPVWYSIFEIKPSTLCGPFSGNNFIIEVITESFDNEITNFIFPYVAEGAALILLSFFLYYYYIKASAFKDMLARLKTQLVAGERDLMFLRNQIIEVDKELIKEAAKEKTTISSPRHFANQPKKSFNN